MTFDTPIFNDDCDLEIRAQDKEMAVYATPEGLRKLIAVCTSLLQEAENGHYDHVHLIDSQCLTKRSLGATIAVFPYRPQVDFVLNAIRAWYYRLKLRIAVQRARKLGVNVGTLNEFINDPHRMGQPRPALPWPSGNRMSGSEIRAALDMIRRKASNAYEIRCRLSEETLRALLPQVRWLFDDLSDAELNEYPIIWQLPWIVGPPLPQELVPAFTRGYQVTSGMARETFVKHLASSGDEAAALAVASAIRNGDTEVMSNVLSGIATVACDPDPVFVRTVSEALTPRFEREISIAEFYAAVRLWLRVDTPSATDRLTRAPFWNPSSKFFSMTIHWLAETGAIVAQDRLRSVLPDIDRQDPHEIVDSVAPS